MAVGEQGIVFEPARQIATDDRWEARRTAEGIVIYYDDRMAGRRKVLDARRDEIIGVTVTRDGLGMLALLCLPLVIPFVGSLAIDLKEAMTVTTWLLYAASPLFFVAAAVGIGYRYFALPQLRVELRDRPPLLLPLGLRRAFEGIPDGASRREARP